MSIDTTDLAAEVAAIKAEHAAATRSRIKAEHERDSAQARADDLTTQLKAEFGVTTVDAASELLTEIDKTLASSMTELRRLLTEAGS